MIFNSLCATASNKIVEEKKHSYPYIFETRPETASICEEKPELCTDKLTSIGVIGTETITNISNDKEYSIPVFRKGKFINALGGGWGLFSVSNQFQFDITNLIVPDGIIAINLNAFNRLPTNTTLITLPDSIKYLFYKAFDGTITNTNNTVTIDTSKLGENCIYFGKFCFREANLSSGFSFNKNLKYIGYAAFQKSNFSGDNGKITFPQSFTELSPFAFAYCTNITDVEFHDNMKIIGKYSFAYDSSLGENKTLMIPDTVKELGAYAFVDTKFSDVIVNYDTIESIGESALQFDSDYNFFANRKTGIFSVGDNIKSLGGFWWCNKFLADKVPGYSYWYKQNKSVFKDYENDCVLDLTNAINIEEIGRCAFSGFHKIKGSIFPPKVKKIHRWAYNRGVNVGKDISTDYFEITHYDCIPDNIEVLCNQWFRGFKTQITLSKLCTDTSNLRIIGDYAFNNYDYYSSTDAQSGSLSNNIIIDNEYLTLPSSLETLGSSAFCGQPKIKYVVAKPSDKQLHLLNDTDSGGTSTSIFENATNLVSIDWSQRDIGKESIPVGFVHNCGYFTTFNYTGTPYHIFEMAFANTSLASFDFREGLYDIRGGAFAKGSISKGEILLNQDIVFPSTLIAIYPQAFHTAAMKSITFNEGLKEIHFDAFEKCTNVTNELVFPSTLEYIGSFAFDHYQNCSNTSITIPASVRIIGEGGDPTHTAYREYNSGSHNFYNCASKYNKEFIVEEGNQWFTAIDGVLFGKDSDGNVFRLISFPRQLKQKENSPVINETYTIPEGVTVMDELCFNYCVGITELILPNSLTISATLPKTSKKLYGDTFYYSLNRYTSYINTTGNTLSVAIYTWHTLQNVTCKEDNPNYKSINGMVYSKDGKSLWYLSDCKTGDIVIAEGTERIEHGALFTQNKSRIKATSLTIPSSVVYIDSACLNYLNNYYIASGVCTVNIDSANTTYGIVDNKVTKL